MKIVRLCRTKYFGPGERQGSRVQAVHLTTGRRVRLKWDDELGSEENHARAAAKLFGREPEFSSSIAGGEHIFGVDPANDPKE